MSTGPAITVIGYDGSPLIPAARRALDEATLVVGGARHLAAVAADGKADLLVLGSLDGALETIGEHLRTGGSAVPGGDSAAGWDAAAARDAAPAGRVCVVASGDPGFFGIVRVLRERGFELRTFPVPSSVATAFAQIGLAWDDAVVVSAHGRDLRPAVNVCRAFPKVAVLTGPGAGAADLAAAVPERTFVVAQRLGEADQRIDVMSSLAAARAEFLDPHVVVCLDEARLGSGRGWMAGFTGAPGRWALPESEFEHRDSMITKAEVRALALAKLGPRPGMLVWDVGAGSGSVGVECARHGAAVIAFEADRESCDRIAANAGRHGVAVEVVRGRAPEALTGQPAPDAVFVGGGGLEVVEACAKTGAPTVVVALAALERAAETIGVLGGAGRRVDGALLQSSRLAVLPGGGHRFAAANPVFLLWGERL